MPTILPTPASLPAPGRRALVWGGVLVALLALPVIALLVLEGLLAARCTTTRVAEGLLPGAIAWRIERRDCAGARAPFHDVLIGAKDKTMAVALTARAEPYPVGVVLRGEGRAEVALSGALPATGERHVMLKLRRSGSPAERIDLEKLVTPPLVPGASRGSMP